MLLVTILLVMVYYSINLKKSNEKYKILLSKEKELVSEDISSLKSEYEKAIIEGDATIGELETSKKNLEKYVDSLEAIKVELASMLKYKKQFDVYTLERRKILNKIDSLIKENNNTSAERDSTYVELNKHTIFIDSLMVRNAQLTDIVAMSEELSIPEKILAETVNSDLELLNKNELLLYSSLLNIRPVSKKFDQLSVKDQFDFISTNYEIWKTNYINTLESIDSYDEEGYYSVATPDVIQAASDEEIQNKKFNNFSVPIITEDGDLVNLVFGTTNDGKSANQKVSLRLKEGLTNVISLANKYLSEVHLPVIESIYIMSTTNGKHGENSNHYLGDAIDISRINDVHLIQTKKSLALLTIFEKDLKSIHTKKSKMKQLSLGGVLFEMDLLVLFERVKCLQRAIQNLANRRENFGPILKTKYYKETNNINLFHSIKGHEDHIHFSVR